MRRQLIAVAAVSVGLLGLLLVPRGERTSATPEQVPEVLAVVQEVPAPPPPEPAPGLPPTLSDPYCGAAQRTLQFRVSSRQFEIFAGEGAQRARLGVQQRPAGALSLQSLEALSAQRDLAGLRAALTASPTDALTAWHLFRATRHDGELDEAISSLETFVAAFPLAEYRQLLARLGVARDLQLGFGRVTLPSGVRVDYPKERITETQAHDIAHEVSATLDEAAKWVGLPRRRQLTVVVYRDREELLAVSCSPTWTGAFYDGSLRLAARDEPLGVARRSLRHETLHAQLDAKLGHGAPQWFEEGVASAFEPAPDPRKAWTVMLDNRSWIPFSSLDGDFHDFSTDDAGLAYAQSLAMVELLRDCGGELAIMSAREAFQRGEKTPAVLAQICRRPEVTGDDLMHLLKRRLGR